MLRTAASAAVTMRVPVIFAALLLTFLLGLGLRLYELDATSLWGDELYTTWVVHPDLSSTIDSVVTTENSPPLSSVVVGSLVNLLGNSDFVYRFASALLGSLSVLLTYKAGEMLWTRKVGLVGSFLLAVNAYHIQYSQWARHYAITVFLVLVSLILFLKALKTGRKGHWLGFAFAAALSIDSHYFAFLALGALAIYGFSVIVASTLGHAESPDDANGTHASRHLPEPRRQALRFACSLALVALLFAPWFPSMMGHLYREISFQDSDSAASIPAQELPAYLLRWPTEYVGMDGPLGLGFLSLSVLGLARTKRKHLFLTALWAGVPVLFSLTVLTSRTAYPKYSIFVLPVYLLAVGWGALSAASLLQRGLCRIARKPPEAGLITTLLVLLAFGVLSVAPLRAYYSSRPHEDWHAASQYLADNMLPGDIVLADGAGYAGIRDSPRVLMALSHYLPIHGTTDTPVLEVRRGLYGDLTVAAQRDSRVWAALWVPRARRVLAAVQYDSIVVFPDVLLIRPSEPSGDVVKDAVSTLDVLLHLMPSEAGRFDVHLALAGIYLGTGRLEDVQIELQRARAVRPGRSRASEDLRAFERSALSTALAIEGVANPTWYNFGGVLALIGYEIDAPSTGSGQAVNVTLWWQALADMDRDYTAFVHAVDQEGRIVAQEDTVLQRDNLPSSGWRLASVAREEYHLQLGPDTAPGDYVIKIGVYYWATGERLTVRDEQARRQPEDTILISMAR